MTDLRRLTAIRGLRNNNPGNIRMSDTTWQGKISKEFNTDTNKAFEQFESLEYGLRALMKNAYTWIQRGKTPWKNSLLFGRPLMRTKQEDI